MKETKWLLINDILKTMHVEKEKGEYLCLICIDDNSPSSFKEFTTRTKFINHLNTHKRGTLKILRDELDIMELTATDEAMLRYYR